MNKKIMIFGGIGLLSMILVSAAVYNYIFIADQDISILQSLSVNGESSETFEDLTPYDIYNGWEQKETSKAYVITNNADRNLNVEAISLSFKDDILDEEGITTTHDTIGLSTTWSMNENANADASLSGDVVTLIVDEHAIDWSDASESRITIDASDVGITTLNDLINMSWSVGSGTGYAPHVDVFLDNGMVLTFEYAKVQTPYDNTGSYPTGSFNTFNDKGIIDDSAEAWIQPGCPGGSQIVINTLADWKLGQSGDTYNFPCDETGTVNVAGFSVDGDTSILRIELEIDAWISNSEVDISNIVINGVSKALTTYTNPITVDKNSGEQVFYVNSVFDANMIEGNDYKIQTEVNLA